MKKPVHSVGIQARLFFLLLIVVVPVLLIAGYITYERLQETKAEAFQANLELARAVARTFDAFVADVLHTAHAIGLAATASPPPSNESLREIMRQAEAANPMIRQLNWISPDGTHLVATTPGMEGRAVSGPDAYRGKFQAGLDWEVTPTYTSPFIGEKIFIIARSIRDPGGKLLGVVRCAILPSKLDRLLAVQRSKDAGVSLIDRAGIQVFRHPETEYSAEQSNWLPEMEPALKGREVSTTVTSNLTGKKQLVAFVPSTFTGWVAAASRAEGDVIARIIPDLLHQVFLILIVGLGAFGAALAFFLPISRWIIRLRDHALALGRGEKEEIGASSSPSELLELAAAFDKMADGLRSREEHIRAIIESAEEAIITLDDKQRVLEANPAAGAIAGVPHHQLIGRFLWEFIDSVDDRVWKTFLNTGRLKGEIQIRHSSGALRVIEASGVANIGLGRHLFVGHDVTERKQSEEALRASETLLRTVTENCADAIFMKDRNSRIMLANRASCAVVGKPVEQIIGRTDEEVYSDPAVGRAIMENDRRIIESGKMEIIEEVTPGPSGPRVFLSTKTPYRDTEGKIIGLVGVARDITERKRAEEELKKSEKRYRTLFDSLNEGFAIHEIILDADGKPCDFRFLELNAAWEKLTGISREKALGKTMKQILPEIDSYWIETCGKVALSGEPVHYENYNTPLQKWYETFAYSPKKNEFAILFIDVTERHRAEEALRESEQRYRSLSDKLEQRVQERTAELERKNKELQEFAFVASHDLSEPLRKIQTFGSFLMNKRADRLGEVEKDHISRMTAAATRMHELLEALLKYSRVETKGEDFRPTNLNDVLRAAVGDLELRLKDVGARVEVSPLPSVTGDPAQLRQLFQNLIANAVKYQEPGAKPLIRISGERQNGTCRVFVEDNGIGFEEKYLGKIFQPFQRLHGRNEYPGIGMGLAICRKIVERHRGRISARSSLGKGSTFIVTLPLIRESKRS